MLRDFASYGLEGATSDFGQIALQFRRAVTGQYQFRPVGQARLGPDAMIRLGFRQREDAPGQRLTVFEGNKAVHQTLEGELWLRESDSAPLRVIINSLRKEDKHTELRDLTTVDY